MKLAAILHQIPPFYSLFSFFSGEEPLNLPTKYYKSCLISQFAAHLNKMHIANTIPMCV